MPFLLLIVFVLLTAACGPRYGKLERYDLTRPGPTTRQLDTRAAFFSGVDRLNTYERFVNGKAESDTSRSILLMSPGAWRSWDNNGNRVEFITGADGGFQITQAHNKRYNSWILFKDPLPFAEPFMDQGRPLAAERPFTTWADGWTTQTGTLRSKVTFTGFDAIRTPAGDFDETCRLESEFTITLLAGFRVELRQRQWFVGGLGEVLRDVDGSWGLLGAPLGNFTSRQVLKSSVPKRGGELREAFAAVDKLPPRKRRRGIR